MLYHVLLTTTIQEDNLQHQVMITLTYLFILCFKSCLVPLWPEVRKTEETSTYSWSRLDIVNQWPTASNLQAFTFKVRLWFEPQSQRWEASLLVLCYCDPCDYLCKAGTISWETLKTYLLAGQDHLIGGSISRIMKKVEKISHSTKKIDCITINVDHNTAITDHVKCEWSTQNWALSKDS